MIDLEAIRRLLKRHGLNDSATDLIVNMADRINTIESAGGTTNLSVDFNDGDLVLQSSSGDDVVLPLAGATTPGLLSAALLAKLQSIDAAHYGAPLQSVTELAALSQASLTDKERRYVEAQLSDYFYDSTATSGDVAPDDQAAATGFWKKVAVGGETATSIKTKYESNADTNVFTDAEKTKLTNLPADAEANVQSDWLETNVSGDAFIQNKPDVPTALDDLTGTLDDIADGTTRVAISPSERTKLGTVQANAEPNAQSDWNVTDANSDAFILNKPDVPTALDDLTGTLDDIADGTTYVRYTPAEQTKLTGIEAGATADQTAAEIKTAYESLVPAATQSEAQAGTETALRVWSPLRVSQAISSLAGSGSGRELLTATRTYFVNASTGNDNNTGLSSGDAFATIQKAVDSTAELDRGTYEVTISVADGTYAAVVLKQCLGSAPVNIIGNLTNPEDVHITTSTT